MILKIASLLFTISLFGNSSAFAQISDLKVDLLPKAEKSTLKDRSVDTFEGGFNELLPYIQPSPSQGNAGTCLFMAHTGVVEWWLNKISSPLSSVKLSERYMMNLSSAGIGDELMGNWRTDTIYRLNKTGVHYFNESYRFTKNWYKSVPGQQRIPAEPNSTGAYYSELYNWVVELNTLSQPDFELPYFRRDVIFADPEQNQWNVNVAPSDIVAKVKLALETKKAPVIAMYNHMGYWHVSVIFGYNDQASSKGCPFVTAFGPYKLQRAAELRAEADQTDDLTEKKRLLARADHFETRGNTVQKAFEANGGCAEKGVFYVRDSLYPDERMPIYDYDLEKEGEEEHLNLPVISREYAWLERLSNHVIQIYVAD